MEKLSKTYGAPRWSGELADCSLPVTMDTYNNCSFGCVYCFSQYQRGVGGAKDNYFSKKVKAVNPEKIKKIFVNQDENSQFYNYIKTKRPIQYGGLSDQFDEFERKYGVKAPNMTTQEFLGELARRADDATVAQIGGSVALKEFLESADLVKFAGVEATPEMADSATGKARSYLSSDSKDASLS